jgi:hypothetical protein
MILPKGDLLRRLAYHQSHGSNSTAFASAVRDHPSIGQVWEDCSGKQLRAVAQADELVIAHLDLLR